MLKIHFNESWNRLPINFVKNIFHEKAFIHFHFIGFCDI